MKRAGCVLVCCDKLTKMIYLIGFKHVPNATETADAFLREIYRLHVFPKVVTTNIGVQFSSQVWKELMEFFGIEVNYATISHYEIVGQVERNNAYVETVLVGTYEDESWMDYLFLAELVHSLGEAKMINSFAHNLGNLKHILEIAQRRYLDNMDKIRTDNYPRYKLLNKVWLKKPENYDMLPFYKLATRKYGPFKVVGVDEEKKNYRLDISRSPFPNMYPVFHVSELELFYKLPKTVVPVPAGNQKIIHIFGSRKHQGQYQYLVAYQNGKQEWVNADVIDDNPHYAELLEDYQDLSNT